MAYRSFSIPALNENLLSDRFSQIDKLFSRLTGEKPIEDTPSYNLLQKDKEHYELTISVPGYNSEDLEVFVLNNKLTINGKNQLEKLNNKNSELKWIHKGIEKKSFSLSFDLDHRINIKSANLTNGLLILQIMYNIPEEEKPKKISINITNPNSKNISHNS